MLALGMAMFLLFSIAAPGLVGSIKAQDPVEFYALLAGIDDYQNINDCAYADLDAIELRNVLLAEPNWGSGNIVLLTNRQATKGNIHSQLDALRSRVDSNDVFLFHFSGHGTYGSDTGVIDEADGYDEYICPADCTSSLSTMIRDDELTDWVNGFPCKMVFIFDSCFSGGFLDGTQSMYSRVLIPRTMEGPQKVNLIDGFAEDMETRTIRAWDLNQAGKYAMSASDADEYAYGSGELQNGVFSYYIMEGLNGRLANTNGDGMVSAEETFAYAQPRSAQYTGYKANPQSWDGIEGEVPVTQW